MCPYFMIHSIASLEVNDFGINSFDFGAQCSPWGTPCSVERKESFSLFSPEKEGEYPKRKYFIPIFQRFFSKPG
jgi:hypothetical protein